MLDVGQHRRVGGAIQPWICPRGCRWRWSVALVVFFVSSVLLTRFAAAGERARPFFVDQQGIIRQRWLTNGGEDVIFPTERILQAMQEIVGKR
jgi:hypothetical protein